MSNGARRVRQPDRISAGREGVDPAIVPFDEKVEVRPVIEREG
jgi:hypothetical protein